MEKIGILWDLDGTIVNSVEMFYKPYLRVFEKYGLGPVPVTQQQYQERFFGAAVEYFLRNNIKTPVSDEQMNDMKWDYLRFADEYVQTSETGGITMIPGVDRVLDAFYEKGYPMAIASTSWMPTVVHSLERIGYLTKFANISSGNLLPSKPAPDVFRIAAEMINIPPERCVVFEDSLAGMKGAKNAGMKCVGIATSVSVSQMTDADIPLARYADLRIEDVEKLFDR